MNCDKLYFRINQKSVVVVILANIAAWFLGAFAAYYAKVYLYTFVFVANVCLAVAIFVSHTMGNPRVQALDFVKFCSLINKF